MSKPDRGKDKGAAERSAERNERVLHTRVPESLETELKEQAANLGVSVSNLVRNVLSNAFGLVDDIVADSERLVASARSGIEAGVRAVRSPFGGVVDGIDRATWRSPAPEPTVIGWQELVMNLNAVCARCNAIVPKGSDAAIAIVDGADARPIICLTCLEEVRHGDEQRSPQPRRDHE